MVDFGSEEEAVKTLITVAMTSKGAVSYETLRSMPLPELMVIMDKIADVV